MKYASLTPQVHRPALRLVSTQGMSREQWLKIRKQGIGASDASAAVGINPYQSPLELWMIKTGRDELMPEDDPNDEESPMYWGNILEPIVAEHYTRRTGNKVRRIRSVLQHPDKDKAWMLANLDYTVVGKPDVQILECKTAGEFGARLWRDGVPEYIECQVQHQLAVTGKQAADVCVLICGQKIAIYRIERDDELIARLIELERRFWHYVETDTPPPADGSDSADKALRYLYPKDNGKTVHFDNNQELSEKFNELVTVREEIELLEQYEARLKQTLQQHMGDATKATFAKGYVSWKLSKDGLKLDTEALLKAQPKLLKKYPQVISGSRRFLIRPTPTPTQVSHTHH